MVLDILCILCGLAVLGLSIWSGIEDRERFVGIFRGLFVGAGVFIAANIIYAFVSLFIPHYFTTQTRNLGALQDGNQTTGAFFLGFGYIDGEQRYSYYLQEGRGYRLENSPADQVVVYQDATKPYAIKQTGCKTRVEWFSKCVSDERVVEIHVPKGTIKSDFVLDAK